MTMETDKLLTLAQCCPSSKRDFNPAYPSKTSCNVIFIAKYKFVFLMFFSSFPRRVYSSVEDMCSGNADLTAQGVRLHKLLG